MENIVIKFCYGKKYKYANNYSIRNLLNYITYEKDKKHFVLHYGTRGLSKKIDKAAEQIIRSQRLIKKNKNRRMYQIVITFPHCVRNIDFVNEVADRIADYFYQDYLVVYGVHTDTDNLHIHFAINAVSYVTGLKYHRSKKELEAEKDALLDIINNIASRYNQD